MVESIGGAAAAAEEEETVAAVDEGLGGDVERESFGAGVWDLSRAEAVDSH